MALQNSPFSVYDEGPLRLAKEIVNTTVERIDASQRNRLGQYAVPEIYLWQQGSPLNMTLTELQVVWRARYGDKWVTEQETRSDPFFHAAATRLHAAGQMERLTASGAALYDVFRIRGDDADR